MFFGGKTASRLVKGNCPPEAPHFYRVFSSPEAPGANRKRCTQSSHWDFDGSASCRYRRGDPGWIRVDFPHFTMAVGLGSCASGVGGIFLWGANHAQRCSFGKIFALRAERSELWSEVVSKIPNQRPSPLALIR